MRNLFQTEAVLIGYQAILKPSRFGYSLATEVGQEIVEKLQADRDELVKGCESKLKSLKRSILKPEPWEEVVGFDRLELSPSSFRVKFSWNEENKPYACDCDLNELTDIDIPLYSGSKVDIIFYQKAYILKDAITYGTSLKLLGLQVISLVDPVESDIQSRFKKRDGYVYKPLENEINF